MRDFSSQPEDMKPRVEITKIDEIGSSIDVINLLEPRMSDKVRIEIEPRTTIAHEYLYRVMREVYDNKRNTLSRILVPRE